jgi:hypothetical protein
MAMDGIEFEATSATELACLEGDRKDDTGALFRVPGTGSDELFGIDQAIGVGNAKGCGSNLAGTGELENICGIGFGEATQNQSCGVERMHARTIIAQPGILVGERGLPDQSVLLKTRANTS